MSPRAPTREAHKHNYHPSILKNGSVRGYRFSTAMSLSEDASNSRPSSAYHPITPHRPFLVIERIGILLEEGLCAFTNPTASFFSPKRSSQELIRALLACSLRRDSQRCLNPLLRHLRHPLTKTRNPHTRQLPPIPHHPHRSPILHHSNPHQSTPTKSSRRGAHLYQTSHRNCRSNLLRPLYGMEVPWDLLWGWCETETFDCEC